MYDFLLQISLFISLGIVVYLFARAVPRVDESGETVHTHGRIDRFLAKLPLDKIDDRLNVILEKTLRKTRIFTMKVDNVIDERLAKLKKNGNGAQARGDLFEKREEGIKE